MRRERRGRQNLNSLNSQLIHRHVMVVHTRSHVARGISPAGHSFNTSAPVDGQGRPRYVFLVAANICGYFITDCGRHHPGAESIMSAKRSISRKSDRSPGRTLGRRRQANELKSGKVGAEQRIESQQTRSGVSPSNAAIPLDKRVEAERQRLFKAISILDCCRLSTASLYEVDDSEYMVPAFEAICDLLTDTVNELEYIASECEKAAGCAMALQATDTPTAPRGEK
jgi:hypothetical protein